MSSAAEFHRKYFSIVANTTGLMTMYFNELVQVARTCQLLHIIFMFPEKSRVCTMNNTLKTINQFSCLQASRTQRNKYMSVQELRSTSMLSRYSWLKCHWDKRQEKFNSIWRKFIITLISEKVWFGKFWSSLVWFDRGGFGQDWCHLV